MLILEYCIPVNLYTDMKIVNRYISFIHLNNKLMYLSTFSHILFKQNF